MRLYDYVSEGVSVFLCVCADTGDVGWGQACVCAEGGEGQSGMDALD